MLSILLPIYNFDCRTLVQDLLAQARACAIPFEIICFDDGSTPSFKQQNRELINHQEVNYQELPQNLGRAKIRNALADAAQFDYLLFMDCDSALVRPDYLVAYLKQIAPNRVLCGGTYYQNTPPQNEDWHFRWHYGRLREQAPVEQRQQQGYHSFRTHHFVMNKAVFQSIRFEEQLTQYGHEDTLFGLALNAKNIELIQLDNPLEHIGLESASVFLQKTQQAIQNLIYLEQSGIQIETKLLQFYQRMAWCAPILGLLFRMTRARLERYFTTTLYPNLRYFDLYKLGLLCHYKQPKLKK